MRRGIHATTQAAIRQTLQRVQYACFSATAVRYDAFCATPVSLQMNYGSKQHRAKAKSFQERQDSRIRKSKTERKTKENQLDNAKNFVDVELPDILEGIAQNILKKCDDMLLALSNMPTLLEKFRIEVDGKERPLIQLGSFTRPSKTELHFLPMMPSLVNPIIQKLSKFDHQLNPLRAAEGKIQITIPQITTKRREDMIFEMKVLEGSTIPRIHEKRKFALKQLKEIAPHLDQQNDIILTKEIDEKIKNAETDFKSDVADKIYDARNVTLDSDFDSDTNPVESP